MFFFSYYLENVMFTDIDLFQLIFLAFNINNIAHISAIERCLSKFLELESLHMLSDYSLVGLNAKVPYTMPCKAVTSALTSTASIKGKKKKSQIKF